MRISTEVKEENKSIKFSQESRFCLGLDPFMSLKQSSSRTSEGKQDNVFFLHKIDKFLMPVK